jgi:hypothetical protein
MRKVIYVRFILLLVLGQPWLPTLGAAACAFEQDSGPDPAQDDRLSLTDLPGYRAALSGRPTADDAQSSDPPARVGFRDLWDHSESLKGRRVTVQGQVARVFRQGPVGSFPPLAEVWITSPAGDPFCLVFPQGGSIARGDPRPDVRTTEPAVPKPGRMIRFTGTFLKVVRYAAGDGDRLAPLVVGDRPPQRAPVEAGPDRTSPHGAAAILRAIGGSHPGAGSDHGTWSPASWTLGLVLALLAAGVLARQHLRAALRRGPLGSRPRSSGEPSPDPPLQFLDSAGPTSV